MTDGAPHVRRRQMCHYPRPASAMRAPWIVLGWVSLLLSGSARAEGDRPVVVLHAWGDGFGAETARHLGDQIQGLQVLKTTTAALSIEALVKRAGAEWPSGLAVALDNTHHQVVVVRPADGTVLSRGLDPARRTTPYAVAVAALEMLDLAGEEIGPAVVVTSTTGARLGFAVDGTFVASFAPGGEGLVPMAGAGAHLVLRGQRWWGSFGIGARAFGAHQAALLGYDLDYRRLDFEARFGLGRTFGRVELMGSADLGGSFVRIEAQEEGEVVGQDQRVSPWAGPTLELRVVLGAGFALKASTGLAFVVNRARFLVQGEPAFEEGAVRWVSSVGVLWASPE